MFHSYGMNRMNREIAQVLLRSLLDRANQSAIGTISELEKSAIEFAVHALTDSPADVAIAPSDPVQLPAIPATNVMEASPESAVAPTIRVEHISLVVDAVELTAAVENDIMLCLDFGTAMSKAFAIGTHGKHHEIKLGERAGDAGYAVPSSLFISENGLVLFGREAIDASQELLDSGRQRLDSIKDFISLRDFGNPDSDAHTLSLSLNPFQEIKLTQGDLIRIYLAFLTDLAVTELADAAKTSRYVIRRFAHPCWSNEQKKWAEPKMREWLAQAQILADTFQGRWAGGISLGKIKSALDQVKGLKNLPHCLIAEGIPEPIAAAAGVMADGTEKREAFMVVDVGAGTTDFGVFAIRESVDPEFSKVFQVPKTDCGLKQAGDQLDRILLKFIQDDAQIDDRDARGQAIVADLKRRIRGLKERLFTEERVTYVLADSTMGTIFLDKFLATPQVQRFEKLLEDELVKSMSAMDDSWLDWIARSGLKVVLTGGGSRLPMIKRLANGPVTVRNRVVMRNSVSSIPAWVTEDADYLKPVFDQLAVAIGGAEPELPEALEGPAVFAGGGGRTSYVANRNQMTGS
jgi:molecular chaperone HscA